MTTPLFERHTIVELQGLSKSTSSSPKIWPGPRRASLKVSTLRYCLAIITLPEALSEAPAYLFFCGDGLDACYLSMIDNLPSLESEGGLML